MSTMQIKRGTSNQWFKGPELIDFSSLNVNGKDSILYCKGTKLKMNILTSSAEDFAGMFNDSSLVPNAPDDKHYGLQILGFEESKLLMARECGNDDNLNHSYELAIYNPNVGAPHYIHVYGKESDGTITKLNLGVASNRSSTTFINTSAYTEGFAIVVLWDFINNSGGQIELDVSLKCSDGYESLLPGQLGCAVEYTSSNSTEATFLKVGPCTQKGERNKPTTWDKIPYVGQIIPSSMYGTSLPNTGVPGQIFYKKV